MCIENNDSLYTSEQRVYTPMVTAAARALNQCVATSCGIDAEDQWKTYSDDFLNDAQIVLDAAGVPDILAALNQITDYARKDGDIVAQHLGGIARAAIAKVTGVEA